MTVHAVPYALQNAAHNADLFRQASSSLIDNAGICGYTELTVTQTGTPSMAVQVAAGRAWVPGSQVSNVTGFDWSTQGMYFVLNDAPVTVTIAASSPTYPRIDVVYVAVADSAYSGASNAASIGVVTGTPAGTPTTPSAPSNSLVLAKVNVFANSSSVTNANIVDARVGRLIRGNRYPGALSLAPTVEDGTSLWDPNVHRLAVASGSSWVQMATVTDITGGLIQMATTTLAAVADSTDTVLNTTTVMSGSSGGPWMHSGSNGIAIDTTCWYDVGFTILFNDYAAGGGPVMGYVSVNNSDTPNYTGPITRQLMTTNTPPYLNASSKMYIPAGDSLGLKVWQASGSTLHIASASFYCQALVTT